MLDVLELVDALTVGFDETVELDDGTRRSGRLPALMVMLDAEARGAAGSPGGGSGVPESRVPVFTPAFDALLAVAGSAARCAAATGVPLREDVAGTLRAVVGALGGVEPAVVVAVERELADVVALARHVLAIDLPPIALRGVRCPYCSQASMLASRRESRAWCTTPGCHDEQGRRYVWSGEYELRLLGASQD